MVRRSAGVWFLVLGGLAAGGVARGQDVVHEALRSFPPQTIRVEYSNPAKLRTVPNYQNLRQRYVGPRLQTLEESFAQLGVRESDVDEVVLGWQLGAETMDLWGFVSGRFTAQVIADRAATQGISPVAVGGQPAYCLGSGAVAACVTVLQDNLAAFGTVRMLGAMLEAREGNTPSLMSNERFMALVGEARTEAPIWGVALGEAAGDWFRAWIPAQRNLQLDWTRTFQSVEALAYNVEAADKVRLEVKLDCSSPEAATSMRQVLEGVRLFQQLAWQNQNPNRPNPFEAVEVSLYDRRVTFRVSADYAELESAGALGVP